MTVTIAVRFPMGRYHATPWDRSVNEGAVEWPPSPWRLLRAFVATWYTRWPDLPAPVLDDLLEALGNAPRYWAASGQAAHSRHYLPNVDHKTGEQGATALTLDPYLSLPRTGNHLYVQWDRELSGEQRATLAKLVELVPYLGRAESVCDIKLLDDEPQPDSNWWRPDTEGAETVRLLIPALPIRRPILELTTLDVRRARRTMPQGTTWATYSRTPNSAVATPRPRTPTSDVTAIRLAVVSDAPLRATHGVLLADEVHRQVTKNLDGGRRELLGHAGATTDHRHAHWIPVPNGSDRGATIDNIIVWAPGGITTEEVAAIINVSQASGRRRGRGNGYKVPGLPDVKLLLQAVGTMEQIAPDLQRSARVWHSLTPYLPVRHRQRAAFDDYLATDIKKELLYRGLPQDVTVTPISPGEAPTDRWALEFRRYRTTEARRQARTGLGVRLTFADDIPGPILLGQLSHFGYGMFIPDTQA